MIKTLHKPIEGRRLKVCAYARVSSDKELQETSFDEQITYYINLIMGNPEWDFAGIFADNGKSGTNTYGRSQFNLMLDKAKSNQIDIILVKSISRFARNVIDLLTTIQELRLKGIEVFFERENLSSLDYKCDELLTCYAKFAEEESESISKNVKWAVEKAKRDGKYFINTWQMLGYSYNENHEIIIVEEEAKWIRAIYNMYVNNHSLVEIQQYLKENNVKSPLGKDIWPFTTLMHTLTNEKYVGDCLMQKEFIEDVKTHKKVQNTGQETQVLIENGHPAIIDRELFNKAQALRESRRKQFKVRTISEGTYIKSSNSSAYTGFAYCPHCGKNYILKTNRKVGYVRKMLYCGSNRNGLQCRKSESLFCDILEDIIVKQINVILANKSYFKEWLLNGFKINESEIDNTSEKIASLRIRLAELDDNIEIDRYVKEEINNQINSLITMQIQERNSKLVIDYQTLISRILELIKQTNSVKTIDDIPFKDIFSRVIVIDRDHLIFVIGSPNLENIDVTQKTYFSSKIIYRVRKTNFECEFGVIINK